MKHVNKIAALVIAFAIHGACNAQESFLEKLEKAVKNQLNQTPSGNVEPVEKVPSPDSSGTDNLPAPRTKPPLTKPGVPLVVPPPPQSNVGGGPVMEDPAAGEQPASARPDTSRRGKVYLGLEAEAIPGSGIGVRVVAITKRSPAWKGGFEIGDDILAINGYGIANLDDMVSQLSKTSPGETVEFLVLRQERNKELKAVLMDADLASRTVGNPIASSQQQGEPHLGVKVNDLTTSFRRQFGLNIYRAAAVSSVTAGSPAQRAGIKAGDAIIEAGGLPIESADALMAWLSKTRPGQQVNLTVYRGPIARNVELVIGISPRSRQAQSAPSFGSGVPSVLESSPSIAPSTADSPDSREMRKLQGIIGKLEAENSELRKELQETRAKLDQIMQLLKNR